MTRPSSEAEDKAHDAIGLTPDNQDGSESPRRRNVSMVVHQMHQAALLLRSTDRTAL